MHFVLNIGQFSYWVCTPLNAHRKIKRLHENLCQDSHFATIILIARVSDDRKRFRTLVWSLIFQGVKVQEQELSLVMSRATVDVIE